MNLSIVYISSRDDHKFTWFLESLMRQKSVGDVLEIILVTTYGPEKPLESYHPSYVLVETQVKPNVWSGRHRLTKTDYWSASAFRNTGICLASHDFIAFSDDRSVASDTWLEAVRDAQAGDHKYCVLGSYEKRHNMQVHEGRISNEGDPSSTVSGVDCRLAAIGKQKIARNVPGAWAFGCTLALPLEWCLAINGYEELCDGLSMEDVIFGAMLQNNGYPIHFDPRMKITEDRTPGQCGPVMKRTSKEKHPNDVNDKGHAALKRFRHLKRCEYGSDLRVIREALKRGEPFPVPTGPTTDWHDNMPISEFE